MSLLSAKTAIAGLSMIGMMTLSQGAQAGDRIGVHISDHGVRIVANSNHDRRYKKNNRGYYNDHDHSKCNTSYRSDRGSHYGSDRRYRKKARGHHARSCHTVYKTKWRHGHRVKIAGTQCYNRYGHAYIVPGSRYVVNDRRGHGHGRGHRH